MKWTWYDVNYMILEKGKQIPSEDTYATHQAA
jgi:hypothetical protein